MCILSSAGLDIKSFYNVNRIARCLFSFYRFTLLSNPRMLYIEKKESTIFSIHNCNEFKYIFEEFLARIIHH